MEAAAFAAERGSGNYHELPGTQLVPGSLCLLRCGDGLQTNYVDTA